MAGWGCPYPAPAVRPSALHACWQLAARISYLVSRASHPSLALAQLRWHESLAGLKSGPVHTPRGAVGDRAGWLLPLRAPLFPKISIQKSQAAIARCLDEGCRQALANMITLLAMMHAKKNLQKNLQKNTPSCRPAIGQPHSSAVTVTVGERAVQRRGGYWLPNYPELGITHPWSICLGSWRRKTGLLAWPMVVRKAHVVLPW